MIAVALAALMAGGYTLWHRSTVFAAKAREHLDRRFEHQTNLLDITYTRRWLRDPNAFEAERVMLERSKQYEDGMYHKYRRAMFFPWLPVDLDSVAPPEPPEPGRGVKVLHIVHPGLGAPDSRP